VADPVTLGLGLVHLGEWVVAHGGVTQAVQTVHAALTAAWHTWVGSSVLAHSAGAAWNFASTIVATASTQGWAVALQQAVGVLAGLGAVAAVMKWIRRAAELLNRVLPRGFLAHMW
jgi:hypothetical protein